MLLSSDQSCLLMVDMQEKLLPVTDGPETVADNCTILMKAAARMSVPILISEQYPKGLGYTLPDLISISGQNEAVKKLTFSCMGEDTYVQRFDEIARCQAVIAGIETHVCVLQTAFDLIERGHDTFVVADAVTSRTPLNRQTALDRMKEAGVTIVTTEMVVFEWLRIAGTPEFKELSALVR